MRDGKPVRTFVLLLIAIFLSDIGQLMLKHGVSQVGALSLDLGTLLPAVWRALSNPFVFFGFVLAFSGSIFWLSVISQVELSYAYPMVSLGYIFVAVSSWLLFGENISLLRIAGILIICFGVFLVSRS